MKTITMLVIAVFLNIASAAYTCALTDDEVTSQHIKEADGISGQNTNDGSGIKTGHIQDSAVTTGKIKDGAVNNKKIEDKAVTTNKIKNSAVTPEKIGFYRNVIIVAASGGDFKNPVSAVDSITDASPANPYLVKIMPGVYDIGTGSVQMKAYVDIEGSGENVTKIRGNVDGINSGVVLGSNNAEIRFLAVENTGGGSVLNGIYNNNVSPVISNVKVSASGATNNNFGVCNVSSFPKMTHVTATGSGGTIYNYGVYSFNSSIVEINHSVIKGTTGSIYTDPSSTTLVSNTKLESSVTGAAYTTCAGVYDGAYKFYADTCP